MQARCSVIQIHDVLWRNKQFNYCPCINEFDWWLTDFDTFDLTKVEVGLLLDHPLFVVDVILLFLLLPSRRRVRRLVVFSHIDTGPFHIGGNSQDSEPLEEAKYWHTPEHGPANDDQRAEHITSQDDSWSQVTLKQDAISDEERCTEKTDESSTKVDRECVNGIINCTSSRRVGYIINWRVS